MEELYTVYEPKTIEEMTWPEVDEALKNGAETIILISGSTENHGPHLPLGTDTFIPLESAKRAVKKLEEEGIKVLIAPPIPFGMAHHHLPFPGSVALRPDTLRNLIIDVCRCYVDQGFNRIVLIAGHSGPEQRSVLINARLEIIENWGVSVGIFDRTEPEIGQRVRKEVPQNSRLAGSHAGEGETADILACKPKLVHLDRAKAYYPEEAEAFYTKPPSLRYPARWGSRKLKTGRYSYAPGPYEYTKGVGYAGDPRPATIEDGNRRHEIFAEELINLIKAMIQAEKNLG